MVIEEIILESVGAYTEHFPTGITIFRKVAHLRIIFRLWKAKSSCAEQTVEQIRELTQGRGADLCIDAVGFEPERNG